MATARSAVWRRALTAAGLTLAACFALPTVMADASPKPDLKTLQKQLRDLTSQVDVLVQQYDKAEENLAQTQRKKVVMDDQLRAEQATYRALHDAVAQMAATVYKNGGGDDMAMTTVMSARNPTSVLDQIALVTAVSKDRGSKLAQFVASAQRLQFDQGQAKAAVDQITQTQASLKAQRAVLEKQISAQKKLIAAAGGPIPGLGTCKVEAVGKALIAVQFACRKLGTPYLWGGTGPLYDCSGLTQAAWGAAGISLPRTTYEQWNAGTHVSYGQLLPGDLVFFDASLGHMGMYLGGGKMIHAPHTGDVVKISDISSGYYRSQFQGGVHVS